MNYSGSVSTSTYEGRYAKLSWTATVSGNTITYNWEVELLGGSSSWYITSGLQFHIGVSGNAALSDGTTSRTVTVLSWDTSRKGYTGSVKTGSFTIKTTGTGASFGIRLEVATYQHSYNCSGYQSWGDLAYTPPTQSTVYVWNGSTWKAATPYVWTGSAWKAVTPYVWNGSTWKSCNIQR